MNIIIKKIFNMGCVVASVLATASMIYGENIITGVENIAGLTMVIYDYPGYWLERIRDEGERINEIYICKGRMKSISYRVRNASGREIKIWVPQGFTLKASGHGKIKIYPHSSDVSWVEKIPEEEGPKQTSCPDNLHTSIILSIKKVWEMQEKEKELKKAIMPCLDAFNMTNMLSLEDRQEENGNVLKK